MVSRVRPIILAMNNPLSADPAHALYPAPDGCAGHRLYGLLRTRRPDVTRGQYLGAFNRRNLWPGKYWPGATKIRLEAERFATSQGAGVTVLVLGEEARRVLHLPRLLVHPQVVRDVTWRQLPHPSGRCRWYNDPTHRLLAAMLMEELYEQAG